jgi:hypothetical protein
LEIDWSSSPEATKTDAQDAAREIEIEVGQMENGARANIDVVEAVASNTLRQRDLSGSWEGTE